MSILSLAPEILFLLSSLLSDKDLSSISRTCRQLHNVIQPQLYRVLQWRWDTHLLDARPKGRPPAVFNPPVHLLLRSLIENPDLGALIQHVDFQGVMPMQFQKETYPAWPHKVRKRKYIRQVAELACQTVSRLQLSSRDTWHQALTNGDTDAYVALALAFMPNLRSLIFGWYLSFINSTFLGSLFTCAFPTKFHSPTPASSGTCTSSALPQWPHLRTVSFGACPMTAKKPKGLPRLLDTCAVLALPALTELTAPVCGLELSHAAAPSALAKALSNLLPLAFDGDQATVDLMTNLTTLNLPNSHAPPHILARILAHKPPLQRLRYYYGCPDYSPHAKGHCFDLSVLGEALRCIQGTLKELVVEYLSYAVGARMEPLHYDGPFTGELGGFTGDDKEFKMLEGLGMPLAMLIGWNFPAKTSLVSQLPRSVKHLCLGADMISWVGYKWELIDLLRQAEDLLKAKSRGEFPALKRIEMETDRQKVWKDGGEAVVAAAAELVQLGERQEVKVSFPEEWQRDGAHTGRKLAKLPKEQRLQWSR